MTNEHEEVQKLFPPNLKTQFRGQLYHKNGFSAANGLRDGTCCDTIELEILFAVSMLHSSQLIVHKISSRVLPAWEPVKVAARLSQAEQWPDMTQSLFLPKRQLDFGWFYPRGR